MLEARSIAVVGASPRPNTFGARMVNEITRSLGDRQVYLVNPRYAEIGGRPCLPSLSALADLHDPVDLVLLGVGDEALASQLRAAAQHGARAAVVFGSAHRAGLREEIRTIADAAGMALCGGGCMGFVNVARGLRALGYLERDPIPAGPLSLITQSGSVFSALLRTHRALGFSLAVSSGQELVTTTADYLEYALEYTDTKLVALVLEAVHDAARLRDGLVRAATCDIPVVLLPVGHSPLGSAMVAAHSGAVAGAGAMWEALCESTGALPVADLSELTDTLELLAMKRRPTVCGPNTGIATVHDSGAERTLVVDLAHELDVPFAALGEPTIKRLAKLLDEGMSAGNPLDVWGTGADTRTLFRDCLKAMIDDPAVALTALSVDLVSEYDGDTAYVDAVLDASAVTAQPLAVLCNLPSAIDQDSATTLRSAGIAVLEGTRSGLVAMRNLLAHLRRAAPAGEVFEPDAARQQRWRARFDRPEELSVTESFELLADYGIPAVSTLPARGEDAAAAAAAELGFPAVLKTGEARFPHRTDVGGVHLGLDDELAVRVAYRDLSARLGPCVLVSATAEPGVELSLGIVRDAQLGPIVVVAAGGVLVELLNDRAVGCPPLSAARAESLLGRLHVRPLLDGHRGAGGSSVASVVRALVDVSRLASEIGDRLTALDINPLIVGANGVVAVDALVLRR